MDIFTYQEKAFTTAMYPEKGSGSWRALSYVGLGMGEAGELQLKIRNHLKGGVYKKEDFNEILIDELGDYFWYGAGLATELGINLADIIEPIESEFVWDISMAGLSLGFAGLIQNQLKKIFRDDEGEVSHERKEELEQLLISYFYAGYQICQNLTVKPEIVFDRNILKLASRKERGVIQGSGDTR